MLLNAEKSEIKCSSAPLCELGREVSLARLKAFSRIENLEIREISGTSPVLGFWMCFIMLLGKPMKIIFKAHFGLRNGKNLLRQALGLNPDEILDPQVVDFMKEFCNLTGGAMKSALERQKIETGLSIPLATRGIDEIFDLFLCKGAVTDRWCIGNSDLFINCSLLTEVYDPSNLDQFSLAAARKMIEKESGVQF